MKNPLHLFCPRRESASSLTGAPSTTHSGGTSRVTVVFALTLLFVCFAGLAAGLRWLKSGEPKDDRPWEPHEALMTSPSADEVTENAVNPDADALAAPPPESSPPQEPPPAIAEEPPKQPESKPPQPLKANNGASARKSATPQPVKSRRKTASLPSKSAPPVRKRPSQQTTKPPEDRSAFDVVENGTRGFGPPSLEDAAETRNPEREAAYYEDRADYFDRGPADRRFSEADQRIYYRRWSRRNVTRLEPPRSVETSPSVVVVRFRINNVARRIREVDYGQMDNRTQLRRVFSGGRIIVIHERQMDDEY